MFNYFIWDVGGTLFDTYTTSVAAFEKTLAEFGLSASKEDIYQQMKETSTGEAAEYFAGSELKDAFEKRYHEIETPMQENPEPFPDTAKTLEEIVARGGKNYIISHRDLQVVDFLENRDVIKYFSYVITSNDGFPRKPAPDSINYLVDRFGVVPEEALMIGDRELDILAGKNAGIKAALFATDDIVQVPQADYTIHHLSDVLDLK
jgi:HAD superfamily hydrolase (TIGR01549 family)